MRTSTRWPTLSRSPSLLSSCPLRPLCPLCAACAVAARNRRRRRRSPPAQLQAAIDKLGDLDYATRTDASRTVRRTAGAAGRARAAAGGRRARRRVRPLSRARAADRLQRSADEGRDARVARQPERSAARRSPTASSSTTPIRAMVPAAPGRARQGAGASSSGPALVRALAALGDDPRVRAGAARARSAAARTSSAAPSSRRSATTRPRTPSTRSTAVAKLDGPLQDDAALALGRIGDKRALETLAALQRTRAAARRSRRSPRPSACSASTASRTRAISIETLKFADQNPGFQELLRGAAAGLGALARRRPCRGGRRAVRRSASRRSDPTRAPVALALATVALRNTPLMLTMLEKHPTASDADRAARRGLRHARGGSRQGAVLRARPPHLLGRRRGLAARATLMQTLIGKLDF